MNSSNCKFSRKANSNVGNFLGVPAPTTMVAMVRNGAGGSSGDSSNSATLNATGQLKAAGGPDSYI